MSLKSSNPMRLFPAHHASQDENAMSAPQGKSRFLSIFLEDMAIDLIAPAAVVCGAVVIGTLAHSRAAKAGDNRLSDITENGAGSPGQRL